MPSGLKWELVREGDVLWQVKNVKRGQFWPAKVVSVDREAGKAHISVDGGEPTVWTREAIRKGLRRNRPRVPAVPGSDPVGGAASVDALVLGSELAKILDAVAMAVDHLKLRDQSNAAKNLAREVRYSPLTVRLEAEKERLRTLVQDLGGRP